MLYESEAGEVRIAVAGDAMISHRLSVFREERYLRLVELFRGADAAFCNMEMPIHDFDIAPGFAEGTYGTAEPNAALDLKWMGINMVSTANNHSYDFGTEGLLSSQQKLDQAGIIHAGTGRNLAEARDASYMDTPRGRVALLATTSTFPEWGKAGEQRPDFRGRPGLSFLRFETIHTVDAQAFQELQRLSVGLGLNRILDAQAAQAIGGQRGDSTQKEMYFQPAIKLVNGEEFPAVKFALGERFSTRTIPHKPDMDDILRWVRDARRQADWVIFSLHSHEGPFPVPGDKRSVGPVGVREVPADFIVDVARACIDEGVDVFAVTGSHMMRGIEIYKGKPIFYSLAEFIFQNETVRRLPTDSYSRYGLGPEATPADFTDARTAGGTKGFPANPAYWKSVVPVCQFRARKLDSIELYPIDLGFGKTRTQRGRPLLAARPLAEEIIENLRQLSQPYHTKIAADGEHWVIRP